MPAVDRYTGVLFDALDAASLSTASRRWLDAHVWIHSAPFGPVAALDAIPTYRLAAGTTLPGMPPLRRHWADPTAAAIAADAPAFVLDLRSEAYAALGPVPAGVPSVYVRVVTAQGRALNHFNKKSKGLLVRALAEDRPRLGSLRGLHRWAQAHDVVLRDGAAPGRSSWSSPTDGPEAGESPPAVVAAPGRTATMSNARRGVSWRGREPSP